MHENITPADRERLAGAARVDTGPFVNPAHLRAAGGIVSAAPPEWLTDVLGRVPDGGVRWLAPWEITLVMLAAERFPPGSYRSPSREAAETARRALDAQRQAAEQATEQAWVKQWADWEALRACLPVPVFVGHNWSLGHYELQTTGKDHIVVQEPVAYGRLRRGRHEALCETPSTRHDLRALDRAPEAARESLERVPTCARCLRQAQRITAPLAPRPG